MSSQIASDLLKARNAVIDVLRQYGGKARFVTELAAALRHSSIGKEDIDQAIGELATEGVIMVRDNFCADPHLADVDLRVVALVEKEGDGYRKALHAIDLAWNKWLGEFLANHRCG